MFVPFFYRLRQNGVPVTPTAFLRLQKALSLGLIASLDDFYTVARTILIKSERDFDVYDQLFAELVTGIEMQTPEGITVEDGMRALIEEWLKDPRELALNMGLSEEEMRRMDGEELIRYFLDRLKDQDEAHDGGRKWIGTGGVSPVGHSGFRPGGMRIGGSSQRRSAMKVALERRYRDYSHNAPLTSSQVGEALKRLRRLVPEGARDVVSVDKTIYETMRNAGEIEVIFDRRMVDRLKVLLLIDNGGWSMEPYVATVQTLFNYARSQFSDLSIRYFHNTVGDRVWCDAPRRDKPESVEEILHRSPETRLIIVGDASMAPEELLSVKGSIAIEYRQKLPSIDRLKQLANAFKHSAWLNPMQPALWDYSETNIAIRRIFPMYELTLAGLERAVRHLAAR